MSVPKAKSRIVMSKRLKNWDGVKDCKIGPSEVEARERGNAHVTGKGVDVSDDEFDDVKARREKFGPYPF